MQRLPTIPIPLPSKLYYGWVIVAVGVIITISSAPGSPFLFAFFISPMMDDLGVSRTALTLSITFRLVAGAVSAPLLGIMIDRFGPRWLSAVSALVAGGSLIGLAFIHSLWPLYLLSIVSGVAGLGGGPGGQLIVSVPVAKWFVAQRGRAMAITSAGGVAGIPVSIIVATWLIQTVGWREAYMIFGIVLLVFTIPVSILFLRGSPEEMGLHPDSATVGPRLAEKPKASSQMATQEDWTLAEAMRTPAMWLIIAAMTLGGVALNGTLINRVAFWGEVGVSPAMVALGTAADPFTVIFASLAFGFVGERLRVRYLGLIAGAGFAVSMIPMIFTTGQIYTVFAHNIIWGAFGGGVFITFNNLIWPNYFGRRFLGTIRGVTMPLTVGANASGAPLYAYLLDSGIARPTLWTISLAIFAIMGILLFFAKPPMRKPAKAEANPVAP